MPVILEPDTRDDWLTAEDTAIPMALLQSYPAKKMTAYEVSTRVNSPKNNDSAIIEPLS